jgi:hypothetical protein
MLKDRAMKISLKKILILGIAVFTLMGCRKEPKGELGTDYNVIEGITGVWVLDEVLIYDMGEPVPPSRDVSMFYLPDPMEYEFSYEDLTYKLIHEGKGDGFIGDEGVLEFNHPEFPDSMTCISNLGDTTVVALTMMVRTIDNNMGYSYTKERCESQSMRYNFSFIRK